MICITIESWIGFMKLKGNKTKFKRRGLWPKLEKVWKLDKDICSIKKPPEKYYIVFQTHFCSIKLWKTWIFVVTHCTPNAAFFQFSCLNHQINIWEASRERKRERYRVFRKWNSLMAKFHPLLNWNIQRMVFLNYLSILTF